MPFDWQDFEPTRLCYFALQKVGRVLPPEVNGLDLLRGADGNRALVRALYDALAARGVDYALEPAAPWPRTQLVRTAHEILEVERRATCLDLAVLFCSVCLRHDLLPVLVVLRDHALVAVSLNNTAHDWQHRKERLLFEDVIAEGDESARRLAELVESGAYLALECTGFARGRSLARAGDGPECVGRGDDGTMTFERAVEAGREQLAGGARAFRFAGDIATYYRYTRVLAAPAEAATRAPDRGPQPEPEDSDPLPLVMDRGEQFERLGDELLKHRRTKPRRPFVCVIHGDEVEYHRGFLDRLKKDLPEMLGFWFPEKARQSAVETYKMTLSLSEVTDDNWSSVFWNDLTRALFDDRPASREDVLNLISRTRLALLLYVPLPSKRLAGVALDRLDRFFQFWSDGWELSERLLLFVCVSLQYQRGYESRRRFLLWKSAGLNDRLRRYVGRLDFSAYEGFHGACLPELRAVTQEDAEAAAEHANVRQRYAVSEREVIWIYNKSGLCDRHGRVPMVDLMLEFEKKRR